MAENPLLPHRRLRELHALMLRCRELERKQKSHVASREAVLAATSIHLQAGDLLSSRGDDRTATELAPPPSKNGTSGSLAPASSRMARLPLCAAAARGLQAAGTDGLVLAFTHARALEPGWQAALEWAQRDHLPLLLACADATGFSATQPASGSRGEPVLDFATISRFAKRLKLAVLTVDGEDAVAVYRVMQESVLRARMGGGPAVLWSVMTRASKTGGALQRSKRPIARLESYLATRAISLPR